MPFLSCIFRFLYTPYPIGFSEIITMKSVIFSVAALVAAVSAQTTTTAASSSSTCGAQPVLEQCLITTQGYIDLCQSTDYNCLCAKYNDLLTCFNNCPNDSRQSSYASSRDVNW